MKEKIFYFELWFLHHDFLIKIDNGSYRYP